VQFAAGFVYNSRHVGSGAKKATYALALKVSGEASTSLGFSVMGNGFLTSRSPCSLAKARPRNAKA